METYSDAPLKFLKNDRKSSYNIFGQYPENSLHVFASSSDWFIGLFVQINYFGFGFFDTQLKTALSQGHTGYARKTTEKSVKFRNLNLHVKL